MRKASTVRERFVADICDAIGNFYGAKGDAVSEGRTTYMIKGYRHLYGFEAVAFAERFLCYRDNVGGDIYAG